MEHAFPKLILAAMVLPALVFGLLVRPLSASASVADWQKGANILPQSSTDFGSASFDQSLRNLAATGANYVALDMPFYQTNISTTDVGPGWNTPTAASLASGIQFAHSIGLRVMLKFNVYSNDGQWSAYIDPADHAAWFADYQNAIMPFVRLAQANGAEEICIGNELISLSTYTSDPSNTGSWEALIKTIRAAYSGKLTYGANRADNTDTSAGNFNDEKDHIAFWSDLDYIGISAYFDLSGDGSVASLMSSWNYWDTNAVQPLANQWGKPVLFTEAGFQAIHDSYTHPWMWWESGTYDGSQQANDYQALFQYWDQRPYMAGVALWNWSSNPNAGGAGDTTYTPQGKPAQAVMQQWFGSAPSASTTPPVLSASANAAPSSPTVGQSASFGVTVKNSGGTVSGANVDMEIYNSAGSRIYQQIFSGQTIASNGSQNYPFSWAPSAADSYILKVGVFSGDWSQLYFWGNQVLAFSAGTGSTASTSTPPSASINVWWPTNGATITGVQPFKAMVPNLSVDSYIMYWQVDGGQLNIMPSNDTDYPHKEASVDVSTWNWRGSGPYAVTFIAKNTSGQVIAQTSVSISH
ncbi:MAG: hypothetical protein KGJ13_07605 [Patescibacteria group bacterium]|nr:hypothetical protein [Patescibacteria group bacterium]